MRNWSKRISSSRASRLLILAGITLTALISLRLCTIPLSSAHPDFRQPWDHHKYIWMAENPVGDFHIAPFCWRIGVPLLAKILPMDMEESFSMIAFMSIWVTSIGMYYCARKSGLPYWAGIATALLFFTQGWFVRANLWNIWKPDPLAGCVSVLAICAILHRKVVLVAIALLLGVMVKESVLFVAPLHYTLLARRLVDWRLGMKTVLAALPAIGVLLTIHILIPMQNHDPEYVAQLPRQLSQVQLGTHVYDIRWMFASIGVPRIQSVTPQDLWAATVGVFGLIPIALALFSPRRSANLTLRWAPFLLMVFMQLLFATNAQRLLALAFPFVLLAAVGGAANLVRICQVHWIAMCTLMIAVVAASLGRAWILVVPARYQGALLFICLAACSIWCVARSRTCSRDVSDS
jgi:hypothetical protein